MKDYYRILELSPDASLDEIHKSFRFLAHIFHPDMAKHDRQRSYFEEKFKEINEAHQTLSNPTQKSRYDAQYAFQRKNLEISPRILHFGTLVVGETASNTFIVDYVGTPTEININPNSSASWLKVKKIESIAPPKTFPLEVEVVASATKLLPGKKYEAGIEVNIDDQRGSVNVSLRVQSRPTAAISPQSFRFRSGEMAHTPEELVPLCDKYWDEGKGYLYDDRHFKNWFIELRRNDIISVLETCRRETNKDIGLDKFLRGLNPTLEAPRITINVENAHLGNYDFSARDLLQPVMQLVNHGRGCCYGILEVKSGDWLSVPYREFIIPPDKVKKIFFRVNSEQLIWETEHTAKVLIHTNSQNAKTETIEFTLTTPRYPKIVEIETLRDKGKWRLALNELNSIRTEGEINKVANQLEASISKKKSKFLINVSIATVIIYGIIGAIVAMSIWGDTESVMLFGGLGAVLGAVGANVYNTAWGGYKGSLADYILASLATFGFILVLALVLALVAGVVYGIVELIKFLIELIVMVFEFLVELIKNIITIIIILIILAILAGGG